MGNWAIYLVMGIKKAPNEVTADEDISDGARTFPGVTLSSCNYEGEIQDISILPGRAEQNGEPLTEAGRSKLRSELWK